MSFGDSSPGAPRPTLESTTPSSMKSRKVGAFYSYFSRMRGVTMNLTTQNSAQRRMSTVSTIVRSPSARRCETSTNGLCSVEQYDEQRPTKKRRWGAEQALPAAIVLIVLNVYREWEIEHNRFLGPKRGENAMSGRAQLRVHASRGERSTDEDGRVRPGPRRAGRGPLSR